MRSEGKGNNKMEKVILLKFYPEKPVLKQIGFDDLTAAQKQALKQYVEENQLKIDYADSFVWVVE